jgi:hypothetical protein
MVNSISPHVYNEMLEELLRVKRLNAELLAALKLAEDVMPMGYEYERVLQAIIRAEEKPHDS